MLCEKIQSGSLPESLAESSGVLPRQEAPGSTVASEAGRKQYERHQRWVNANRERAREHARNWYHRNKEDVKIRQRLRRAQKPSKPASKDSRRRFYLRHAEKIKAKVRAWNTSEIGRAYAREYQRKRRRENPHIHFLNWLRGSVNRILRSNGKRGGRTMDYIGCTPLELRTHLESQFTQGMSWGVPRKWDADHIVPVSAFLLSDKEEALWACNFRNLRPMWRLANQIKSDTLPTPLPSWLPTHIAERIIKRAGAPPTNPPCPQFSASVPPRATIARAAC